MGGVDGDMQLIPVGVGILRGDTEPINGKDPSIEGKDSKKDQTGEQIPFT